MHGRQRFPVGLSVDKPKEEGKARKLSSLWAEVLRNHQEHCYTKEALKQSAQLLELNPEIYTAWNYRKLAVQHLMNSEPDVAARKQIAEVELRLVERALRANVKSYGAWYHRKWVIDHGLSSLDHEFLLLQRLLKDDARNFHGWKYRRFVVTAKNVSAEKELEYVTEKINENFSNYTAWHYRSTLLSKLVKGGATKEEVLKDEYELVNQAYFTEPDDQSAWFYNSWLLGETRIESGAHLVGSWPVNGSNIVADFEENALSVSLSSRNPLGEEYSFRSDGVPVILSFSEIVTDVVVKVTSKPELGHLNDVLWRSLSRAQGPSKTWVAELSIQGCLETDYAISLGISFPDKGDCEVGIMFNLHVRTGHISKEADSGAKRTIHKGDIVRSSKILSDSKKEERRHAHEEEGSLLGLGEQKRGQGDPGGVPLSEESQQKAVTSAAGMIVWQQRVLEEQIQSLRELLELEENSKWAKLTLSRVLIAHSTLTHNRGQYTDEILDLLKELTQIDPVHRDHYEELRSSILVAKVLRNAMSIKQLWCDACTANSEHLRTASWLRWNGLSLSRFDAVGKLLWVQRLDLSHNQLRSVQGLEEMQLLVALDLSYNRISHVTSLANLSLNSRLQSLNISFNEIGSHSVDCARYTFPSVLTNQRKCSSLEVEILGADLEDQWEVWGVFGGMDLRTLEIAGNVAANNKAFREAVRVALPSLESLDGVEVQRGI